MRAFLAASTGAFWLAACAGGHYGSGPAGITYLCGGQIPARIVYRGGGYYPTGKAVLHYEGRAAELEAALPTYGLRYQGESLIWSVRGEEAWLHERGSGAEERELAHCTRVREPGAPDVPASDHHGESGNHH